MSEDKFDRQLQLLFPAECDYAIVAGMTLSGLGMLAGLDMDALGDLRMVTNECLDCLFHQGGKPKTVCLTASVIDHKLQVCFEAQDRELTGITDKLTVDITRSVLETLMPQVQLCCDEAGVHTIICSMGM